MPDDAAETLCNIPQILLDHFGTDSREGICYMIERILRNVPKGSKARKIRACLKFILQCGRLNVKAEAFKQEVRLYEAKITMKYED